MIKRENEILKIARNRRVKYLVHFTRVRNLSSILKYGVLPNNVLKNKKIKTFRNDPQRLDCTDAVCLSISFPNYKLFYRVREKYDTERWAVLLIDPEILNDHRCAFAYTNAASNTISYQNINTLMNVDSFRKMFHEPNDWRTRDQMMTATNETTDPQAEVLVFDSIAPNYIKGIVLQNNADVISVKNKLPSQYYSKLYSAEENLYFSSGRGRFISYFDSRPDYRYWRY